MVALSRERLRLDGIGRLLPQVVKADQLILKRLAMAGANGASPMKRTTYSAMQRKQLATDSREILADRLDALAELLRVLHGHEVRVSGQQLIVSIHLLERLIEFVAAAMQCGERIVEQ